MSLVLPDEVSEKLARVMPLVTAIGKIQKTKKAIESLWQEQETANKAANSARDQLVFWLISQIEWNVNFSDSLLVRFLAKNVKYSNLNEKFGIDNTWLNFDENWTEEYGCLRLNNEGVSLQCEDGKISLCFAYGIETDKIQELATLGIPVQALIEGLIQYHQASIKESMAEQIKLRQILEDLRNETVKRKDDCICLEITS